jgi:hypothetical protein
MITADLSWRKYIQIYPQVAAESVVTRGIVQEGIKCMLVNFASELMIGQWEENNRIVVERLEILRTSGCGYFLTNHQFAGKSLQACTQSLGQVFLSSLSYPTDYG